VAVPKVTFTVITRDEARNIAAALESVAWADEIVVVDSGSSDATVDIARRHTPHVSTYAWEGYGAQKNHAAALASNDWIFSLDADERVSPELAQQIRETVASDPPHRGYRVPRVAFHLGRWMRSTDWYPDRQLRLYDRRAGKWNSNSVHESVRVAGSVGELTAELQHYPYRDVSHHLDTIDRYTTLAARDMAARGRRTSLAGVLLHPPVAFFRNYLFRGGIRDGMPGLIVSAMNSYYVLLKFAKLWELQKDAQHRR
jgi:glycosyltransferase involved in cell wall biosynthesis